MYMMMNNKCKIGDIVADITDGARKSPSLYGMIIDVRNSNSYFVDWFVDESVKNQYSEYMYQSELVKVTS